MTTVTRPTAPAPLTQLTGPLGPLAGLRVIDADTHLTEPHDLWTSRAPAAFEDRVPHVVDVDGEPTWVVDGVGSAGPSAGGVVAPRRRTVPFGATSSSG